MGVVCRGRYLDRELSIRTALVTGLITIIVCNSKSVFNKHLLIESILAYVAELGVGVDAFKKWWIILSNKFNNVT